MAETVELVAQVRQEHGSQAMRRLRRQGKLPAVLYGHKEETVSLTLPKDDVVKALRHGVRVLDLKTNGTIQKALIREIQWDYLGKEILHVDFYRISADERVVVTVPLELRGTAPGVAGGGILEQPLHHVEIECLALNMPESIRVNIGNLQLNDVLHIRDLTLPPGVKVLAEEDAVVVQIKPPQEEEEEAAAVVEPELIRKPEKEEEKG
ncbi:MAG: 50S ribosomal protein L25 [Gemmataceae bacterium]